MLRYRYCTPALTGPWRASADAALGDAVKANQAQIDKDQPAGIRWIVPGRIEEEQAEEARRAARS